MRTSLILASMLAAAASPACAGDRNFGVSGFTKIRVDGPYKVNVTTGIAPFAKASGAPAAIDRVAIDVRGDTLLVHSNPSWGGYPGTYSGPVEVSIGTHELESVSVMGAGSVAIDRAKGFRFALSVQGSGLGTIEDVEVDQLSVNLAGTASAKLTGRSGKVTALVRGLSALDAGRLTAQNADLSADGTATIEATVTDTARVSAWGPATIRLAGGPTCELKITGSTAVSGCR